MLIVTNQILILRVHCVCKFTYYHLVNTQERCEWGDLNATCQQHTSIPASSLDLSLTGRISLYHDVRVIVEICNTQTGRAEVPVEGNNDDYSCLRH